MYLQVIKRKKRVGTIDYLRLFHAEFVRDGRTGDSPVRIRAWHRGDTGMVPMARARRTGFGLVLMALAIALMILEPR